MGCSIATLSKCFRHTVVRVCARTDFLQLRQLLHHQAQRCFLCVHVYLQTLAAGLQAGESLLVEICAIKMSFAKLPRSSASVVPDVHLICKFANRIPAAQVEGSGRQMTDQARRMAVKGVFRS